MRRVFSPGDGLNGETRYGSTASRLLIETREQSIVLENASFTIGETFYRSSVNRSVPGEKYARTGTDDRSLT